MNQNHKIVRLTDCYPLHKLQNMKRKKSDNCSLVFEWRGEQGVVNMNYQFEQAQTVINYIVEKMKGVEMMAKAKKQMFNLDDVTGKKEFENINQDKLYDSIEQAEISCLSEITVSSVNNLMNLYQKAIEYFSALNNPIYINFINQLQNLLQRPDVQSILDPKLKIQNQKEGQQDSNQTNQIQNEKKQSIEEKIHQESTQIIQSQEKQPVIQKENENKIIIKEEEEEEEEEKEEEKRSINQEDFQILQNFKEIKELPEVNNDDHIQLNDQVRIDQDNEKCQKDIAMKLQEIEQLAKEASKENEEKQKIDSQLNDAEQEQMIDSDNQKQQESLKEKSATDQLDKDKKVIEVGKKEEIQTIQTKQIKIEQKEIQEQEKERLEEQKSQDQDYEEKQIMKKQDSQEQDKEEQKEKDTTQFDVQALIMQQLQKYSEEAQQKHIEDNLEK